MMFWQEDDDQKQEHETQQIVDLLFDIKCREIPVDHSHALSTALKDVLPKKVSGEVGIHTIHVAGSQNGWERPAFNTEEKLLLSHRTKLTLRVPRQYSEEIQHKLKDQAITIAGCELTIGKAKEKPLSKLGTIFSRYVQCETGEDEMVFMQRMIDELRDRGISIKKALCGKTTYVQGPEGPIETRSLMLADLNTEDSLKLQKQGLGPRRDMGFGIFIPHKGIEAVKKLDDNK